MTAEMINDARQDILEHWGDAGATVIAECEKVQPFNGRFADFLNHCITCGGDWGGMLLTGIHKLYPTVWDAIPEHMGYNAFALICGVLMLCGVDTSC